MINCECVCVCQFVVTLACAGGFLDVVKILLSNGADINLGQSTPLMEASQEGHIELVQFLIENGTILCLIFMIYSFFLVGANVLQTTRAGDSGN